MQPVGLAALSSYRPAHLEPLTGAHRVGVARLCLQSLDLRTRAAVRPLPFSMMRMSRVALWCCGPDAASGVWTACNRPTARQSAGAKQSKALCGECPVQALSSDGSSTLDMDCSLGCTFSRALQDSSSARQSASARQPKGQAIWAVFCSQKRFVTESSPHLLPGVVGLAGQLVRLLPRGLRLRAHRLRLLDRRLQLALVHRLQWVQTLTD